MSYLSQFCINHIEKISGAKYVDFEDIDSQKLIGNSIDCTDDIADLGMLFYMLSTLTSGIINKIIETRSNTFSNFTMQEDLKLRQQKRFGFWITCQIENVNE